MNFLLYIILLCFFSNGIVRSQSKRVNIILNVFDKKGLDGSIWFLENLQLFSKSCIGQIYIFIKSDLNDDFSNIRSGLNSKFNSINLRIYRNNSLPDVSIRKFRSTPEYVSNIFESWLQVANTVNEDKDIGGITISLCFNNNTIPNATPNFLHLIERLNKYDIILLGKTISLNSVSNWHDLLVASFDVKHNLFLTWLNTLVDVYHSHNLNRKVFSLLEPRPAIIEVNTQFRSKFSIGYFDDSEICSTPLVWGDIYTLENKNLSRSLIYPESCHIGDIMNQSVTKNSYESRCHHLSMKSYFTHGLKNSLELITGLEIYCGIPSVNDIKMISDCILLHRGHYKKVNIHHDIPKTISDLVGKSKSEWTNHIMYMLWKGIIRFRDTTSEDTPRPFCWETGSLQKEELAKCKIEYSLTHSEPFTHPDFDFYDRYKSNISAVIMVGTSGSTNSLNEHMYLTLSKQYYAARHGYSFHVTTSNEYYEYFSHDLFKDMPEGAPNGDYFYGIMTKPVMILDVMHKYPDEEWIVWTDDDTYINTGFLYLPLDAYLSDVPENKVFVLANYRSAFTNVFAVRNNIQGRKVMRDWIAITMSGYIQCHGYDQAALGVLIANRISGDIFYSKTDPLGFSCLYNRTGSMGCNSEGDWSCDFKFEWALHNWGFKSDIAHDFFGDKISSFSKGCANNYVEDFHIISETSRRPRFQCGLCTRASEIESSGDWDGPLGGGNNLLLPGAVNGWFFNHKMDVLFYEQYANPNNCKKLDGFALDCNEILTQDINKNNEKSISLRPDGRLLSLTDGYAFDLENGRYCKLKNEIAIQYQKENTYMIDYKELIAIVNNFTIENFTYQYQSHEGGGYGRRPCNHDFECVYGANEDGQAKRRPPPPYNKNEDEKFFEKYENYCDSCHEKVISNFDNLGYDKKVIDCTSLMKSNSKKDGQNSMWKKYSHLIGWKTLDNA